MAKLPGLKKLVVEDFSPKERGLVGKIAFVVNPFFTSIVDAFNKRLTFGDNFDATDMEIDVTAPVTASSPVSARTSLNRPVRGILVLRVDNLTNNNSVLASAPHIDFVNSENQTIKLINVTGLVPGNKYKLRVVIFP